MLDHTLTQQPPDFYIEMPVGKALDSSRSGA
jgi:hypothetical protein